MVGTVLVSHSKALVDALAEVVRLMAPEAPVAVAGGLEDVLSAVPVGRVVVPEATVLSELPAGCAVEEVGYGDALGTGRFSLEVVSPVVPAGGEGNEGSLELLLSFDDGGRALTGLLAADAEVEETSAAVARGGLQICRSMYSILSMY